MGERSSDAGIPLEPSYSPDAERDLAYADGIAEPGEYPFTRGRRRATHSRQSWIHQELSGEGTPRRSNEQFRHLISQGARGVDIIGDAPTAGGMDPDHPLARYAVGNQGVSLCRLQDFAELYADLPFDQITVSHSLPHAAYSIAALHSIAKQRGFPTEKLRGSNVQIPLYCEDCCYELHMPYELRMRLTLDSIEFASKEMPLYHPFLEDTYYISDGGLNVVEEMALGFVEIREVVRKMIERGLDIDSFAPRIAILVNCRMDFFEEIAKIRATRRIFARMMREEFGAKDPRSWSVNVTSHTSGLTMTLAQPINNVVRGAVQSLALACAGVQAAEISCFDEAYRTPSPEAHRVGLRTQQIIQLEAGADRVTDPLGGSYFIESLTDQVEQRILEMMAHIESLGDPAAVSESGWFRRLFEDAMTRHAQALQDGTRTQVGVNTFVIPEEDDTLLRNEMEEKIEPEWERIEEIKRFKAERDLGAVREGFARLREEGADAKRNIMPALASALENNLTYGEISGALRLAYGAPYDPFGQVSPPV